MEQKGIGALEDEFRDLAEAFGGILEWKWDGRFKTALAEFPVEKKDEVLGILEQYLVSTWDSTNVKDAPDVVQEMSKCLGGLMSGQLLLLPDSRQAACIFCAWWPWGSGAKISIRIGPYSKELSDEEAAELVTIFRGWFKI
ncbi:hypothetical protein ACFLS5_04630 [Candidatus Bipolaricaulota bacterium]